METQELRRQEARPGVGVKETRVDTCPDISHVLTCRPGRQELVLEHPGEQGERLDDEVVL